ncbi:MAG TPA: glycosyltransferase family 4 protein [Pyrinomonadaceae bacterium]|nr:glycosyltransferase family 4 protein [Pyrinomonadaceae bacterium]
MHICYFADGRYIHTYKWMRYFSERGHRTSLLSFAPLERRHVAAVEEAGGSYHGEIGPFHLKRFWRTAHDLFRLLRLLRRERVDVLHCHFLGANAWYAALSRFHPFVITVMGGDVCGPDWRPKDELRERYLTPLALREADLVTCWSQKLTGIVSRYTRPGTPVEVVHGGVDLKRFRPGPKPDYLRERWDLPASARVVLSPRLMAPLYNLERIAEAARIACAEDADAHFLFAYQPEAKDEEYERKVRAAVGDARDRVRFIGAIEHGEMADHFRLADAVVSIPSTDGTPMSVLEAMACGTPVVVSRIPDYDPHYIEPGETVLAVKTDESEALAAALLSLLRDSELAARLSSEAKRRVELSGSYEAQMSHMEQLYERLV